MRSRTLGATLARRIFAGMPLILAVVVTLPAGPARAESKKLTVEQQGIELLMKNYAGAWIKNRPPLILHLFEDDAVLLPHSGAPPVQGPDAMRDYWWPDGGADFWVTKMEITPDEIVTDGNLGYYRGRFSVGFDIRDGEKKTSYTNEGNILAVFHRDDGLRWYIKALSWDDPMPTAR
ncbi:MAG TPA: nuclear transport factor 2 family protein [Candidatus Saccharimonadales bacterium]|nr:nuclear transport factor 2 family protein [Candidatus Saccharimonadales bacterium]